MNIRVFDIADTASVIALWQLCGLVVPQNDPELDISRKLAVNPELFLVGTDSAEDREIVATVMGGYEGHRGWINYLAVDPTHRGRGFGRAIMSAVEERIHALGCPKINLQVRSSNVSVIRFYQSLGYGDDNVVGLGKRLSQD
jgi:ribosomal protein S18 acetylase RimI-like enzyme